MAGLSHRRSVVDISHGGFNVTQALGPRQQAWVDALLSGKLKQTQGFLSDNEHQAFCCLGVACELAIKEVKNDGILSVDPLDGEAHPRYYSYEKAESGTKYLSDHSNTNLPEGFVEYYKLYSSDGEFYGEDGERVYFRLQGNDRISCLIHLNDTLEWNFTQIGNFIRNHAEVIFKEPV